MKIGFVGCGAIGSCYASYLSREHEVCVLDTYAPVIESIKKNGILVDECVPVTGTGETVVFHPDDRPQGDRRCGSSDRVRPLSVS